MRKRVFSLCLSLALCLGLSLPAAAASIFTMEHHIQRSAHLPRPHIIVGVDIDPIVILSRFHMGTEDLIHIKPTCQVEIEDAIYLFDLTLESNIFREQPPTAAQFMHVLFF